MVPRIELIEDNIKFKVRSKESDNSQSTIQLIRKKNVDYFAGVSEISRKYMEGKGFQIEESPSVRIKPEIGMSEHRRQLLNKGDQTNAEKDKIEEALDDMGFEVPQSVLPPDQQEIVGQHIDKSVLKKVIRNKFMLRDEEKDLKLA